MIKQITKFGNSLGLPPGPDTDSTNYGDPVYLKLTFPHLIKTEQIVATKKTEISCRNCKGAHWTTQCPYKEQIGTASHESAIEKNEVKVNTTGKYVPPTMRAKGEVGAKDVDDCVIRISNLSEDSVDNDVRDLVSRFGEVSRVFVAKDRETYACKGYAFITFLDKADAAKAIQKLDGYGYGSLILKVEWAKTEVKKD